METHICVYYLLKISVWYELHVLFPVSPSLNNPTLQSLLTSPTALQGPQLGLPEGIQIITVSSPSSLLPTQTDGMGRIWHVINPDDTIIAVGNEDLKQLALANGKCMNKFFYSILLSNVL